MSLKYYIVNIKFKILPLRHHLTNFHCFYLHVGHTENRHSLSDLKTRQIEIKKKTNMRTYRNPVLNKYSIKNEEQSTPTPHG